MTCPQIHSLNRFQSLKENRTHDLLLESFVERKTCFLNVSGANVELVESDLPFSRVYKLKTLDFASNNTDLYKTRKFPVTSTNKTPSFFSLLTFKPHPPIAAGSQEAFGEIGRAQPELLRHHGCRKGTKEHPSLLASVKERWWAGQMVFLVCFLFCFFFFNVFFLFSVCFLCFFFFFLGS